MLLIDTGFRSAGDAERWRLTFTGVEKEMDARLAGALADNVVITHSHFDHIDNLDLYPQAEIVIAREAMEQALEEKTMR